MSKRDDQMYKEDILASITKIEKYMQGMTYEVFQHDEKTIDAVVRNIEIIGEAARYISDEVKDRNDNIPWQRMVHMRNKVIHEYFGLDTEILWETLVTDIPTLKQGIIDILF